MNKKIEDGVREAKREEIEAKWKVRKLGIICFVTNRIAKPKVTHNFYHSCRAQRKHAKLIHYVLFSRGYMPESDYIILYEKYKLRFHR